MWLRWEVWLPFDLLLSSEGMADGRRLNLARIFAASSAAMPDLLPPGSSLGCEASPAHSLTHSLAGWLARRLDGLSLSLSVWGWLYVHVCVSVCVAACVAACLFLVLFLIVFVYWPVVFRLGLTRPTCACYYLMPTRRDMGAQAERRDRAGEADGPSAVRQWQVVVAKSRSCSPSARERSHMPAVGLLETRRVPFDNSGNGLTD